MSSDTIVTTHNNVWDSKVFSLVVFLILELIKALSIVVALKFSLIDCIFYTPIYNLVP